MSEESYPSPTFASQTGEQLYHLLPAEHRIRDLVSKDETDKRNFHLAKYLDSYGELFDDIYDLLEQRLADSFPFVDNEDDVDQRKPQDWLLPYFADLIDVRLTSPLSEGKRAELKNGVLWRQKKGNLNCIEEIAEEVGQFEVEVQEGWKRVAMTPHVNKPILPAEVYGTSFPEKGDKTPVRATEHPGLPVLTLDFRKNSRAVQSESPYAKETSFDGEVTEWVQKFRHGVPCFSDSYQDVSRRMVDMRTSNWKQGHAHPKKLLLHVPPPAGFFPKDTVELKFSKRTTTEFQSLVSIKAKGKTLTLKNKTNNKTIVIKGAIDFSKNNTFGKVYDKIIVKNLNFSGTLKHDAATLHFFDCAVNNVNVVHGDLDKPYITAVNSLFDEMRCLDGLVMLEYCTVLKATLVEKILASDCVLATRVSKSLAPIQSPTGCIRYSSIPQSLKHVKTDDLVFNEVTVTTDTPIFYEDEFSSRSAAVLHSATSEYIRFGAEDGGEMGCYHSKAYCLKNEAVSEKLKNFLPVGMEAVLVADTSLLCIPPTEEIG